DNHVAAEHFCDGYIQFVANQQPRMICTLYGNLSNAFSIASQRCIAGRRIAEPKLVALFAGRQARGIGYCKSRFRKKCAGQARYTACHKGSPRKFHEKSSLSGTLAIHFVWVKRREQKSH